jgi:hypothetical protein
MRTSDDRQAVLRNFQPGSDFAITCLIQENRKAMSGLVINVLFPAHQKPLFGHVALALEIKRTPATAA